MIVNCIMIIFNLEDGSLFFLQIKLNGQSKDAIGKASGFHQRLTGRGFVVFGHFVWDVVVQLAKLSLSLQNRACSVADVADKLQATISVLEHQREQ